MMNRGVKTAICFVIIMVATSTICPYFVLAQIPNDLDIPDSTFVQDQLLIWFQDSTLNLEYLGGYGEMADYPYSNEGKAELPINTDFIKSSDVVSFLQSIGALSLHKVVPWIDPYSDSLSVTRRGDTVAVAPIWNLLRVELDPSFETDELMAAYQLVLYFPSVIRWAQPNMYYKSAGTHNPLDDRKLAQFESAVFRASEINDLFAMFDTYEGNQISIKNSLQGVYAEAAWIYNTGSSDVLIAVIDDGIEDQNPDFTPTGKLGLSPKKVYGVGGQGGHGTDMAGIIGAVSDNNIGIAGIAGGTYPNSNGSVGCPLYILDAYDPNPTTGQYYRTDGLFNAITEASYSTTGQTNKGYGVHTVNFSIYMDSTDPIFKFAASVAYLNGVTLNASMGNTGDQRPQYPAALEDIYVLSVGAKAKDYSRLNSSSYGPHIDMMAPGYTDHIYTTINNSSWGYSVGHTSAAAAHATGVSGLLISEYITNTGTNVDKPYFPEDIENLLEVGCTDQLGQLTTSHDIETGWGMINAANSIEFLHSPYVLKHYTADITISQLPAVAYTLPSGHYGVPFYNPYRYNPPPTFLKTKTYWVHRCTKSQQMFSSLTIIKV